MEQMDSFKKPSSKRNKTSAVLIACVSSFWLAPDYSGIFCHFLHLSFFDRQESPEKVAIK